MSPFGPLLSLPHCGILARQLPLDEPIDLLNVAFENTRNLKARAKSEAANIGNVYDVPDRLTGREQVEELRRLCPDRTWNFVRGFVFE